MLPKAHPAGYSILDWPDKSGLTPFDIAITTGNVNLAKILITDGAYIHARISSRFSPIFLAVTHNHRKIIKLLIESKVSPDARDSMYGFGPILLLAAGRGSALAVQALLEKKLALMPVIVQPNGPV